MHRDDCNHDSYTPLGLVRAIIIVMVFQTVVVSVILVWTTTRWTVSPSDAMKTIQKETDQINRQLEELTKQIQRHIEMSD